MMAGRDTRRYMKNVNKLFGAGGASLAGNKPQHRSKVHGDMPLSLQGQGLSHRQAAKQPLASSSRKRKQGNSTGEIGKRMIHWQHYENIFRVMDNLKYQFPALGYERFFTMFTELFMFYRNDWAADAGEDTTDDLTSVDDNRVKWVSSFGIDPSYYGRLTESDLYHKILLPAFGAACGTFERAVLEKITVNGRNIASCFSCNAVLSRLVKCSRVVLRRSASFTAGTVISPAPFGEPIRRVASAVSLQGKDSHMLGSAFNGYDDEMPNTNEGDEPALSDRGMTFVENIDRATSEAGVKDSRIKRKSAKNSAAGHGCRRDVSLQVRQDAKRYNAHLMALAIDSTAPIWCDCCICSYRVLLAFDDNDDGINWREYYRSMVSPTVYVNARVLLGWPLTNDDFLRDFKLEKKKKTEYSHQSRSFLSKTVAIYKMGFYQRIYSLHLWIYFIVMWLWNCQRSVHERCTLSSSTGNEAYNTFALAALPVQLVVQKKLRKIFEDVPSLPLTKLLKTRKVLIQYV